MQKSLSFTYITWLILTSTCEAGNVVTLFAGETGGAGVRLVKQAFHSSCV
jgi:hypothetical protein